jgi:hypothetical protein
MVEKSLKMTHFSLISNLGKKNIKGIWKFYWLAGHIPVYCKMLAFFLFILWIWNIEEVNIYIIFAAEI